MRIKFIDSTATSHECFVGGRVYDLDHEQADAYVRAKLAQPVTDDQPPAVEVKAKGRRATAKGDAK